MKRSRASMLAIVTASLLLFGSWFILRPTLNGVHSPILDMIGLFYFGEKQMSAGRHYMDSLTPSDIASWIDRSKALLDQYKFGTEFGQYEGKKVPQELQKLEIIDIQVNLEPDTVRYVWMGGLDHCYLEVQRQDDGSFEVTAQYSDENRRTLWPNK